jgi:hypothetical protein
MKKLAGISFLLFTYVILLMHNIIPHHTHEIIDEIEVSQHSHHSHTHHTHLHCEDETNNSDTPCNEESCEELIIHDLTVLKTKGLVKTSAINVIDSFYLPVNLLLNRTSISITYSTIPIPPHLNFYCFDNHLIPTGLRAPPFLMV